MEKLAVKKQATAQVGRIGKVHEIKDAVPMLMVAVPIVAPPIDPSRNPSGNTPCCTIELMEGNSYTESFPLAVPRIPVYPLLLRLC
jgi:hypothetical protein